MPIQNIRSFVQDLNKRVDLKQGGTISNADNNGVVVSVSLYHGQEEVTVSGSVAGAVVCPDGSTVALQGSYSGNVVSVAINSDCLGIPGDIGLGIQVTDVATGTKTTVFRCAFTVDICETNNPVDPGSRTTLQIANLIAAIDTAVASIPPEYDELVQEVSNLKSATNVEFGNVKTALDITESLGEQLTRTANDDGCYWRYVNNAWQRTATAATSFWHVETYTVTPGVKYSVTGNIYHPAVPACIFLDRNNNIIGSTEIPADSTWQQELKTYDVVIPANCTQIYVNKFYNDQSAVVKPYTESSAVKTTANDAYTLANTANTTANTANTTANTAYASTLKYNEQTAYITLDERYFSVATTSTGLDITLPYRFTLYYQSAKAAAVKNLASGVDSVTYSVANGGNLVFDLTDNTMKIWQWADISSANKDNYLLMASVGNKEINGGILKAFWNYQLAKRSSTAYDSSLKYDNQACYVTLDEQYFSVNETSSGLDITLPKQIYLYYQSEKTAAIKTLTNSGNDITYSVANGGNLIFDLTDSTMKIWQWADISTANKDYYILMASVGGKRISGGILKQYWNYQLAKQAINNQYPIPYYYESYMPDKITEIENACAYKSGIAFPFVTDLHLVVNPKQSGKLIKYIGEHTNAVPFVISGGDIALADGTEESILAEAQMWLEYMDQWGREKTIQVHGNHDYNCRLEGGGTWNATPGQLHYYIAANTLRVERPEGALYGTYDVVGENIRIIIIDDYAAGVSGDTWQATTGLTDTQLDWVKAKILEFGGSVLIVSHQTADSTLVSYESVLAPLQTMLIAAKNKTGDFSAWGGEIIMHLSGHSHQDESHVDNNLLSVTTVCDAAYTQPSGYTRTWGATSEQAFDIVCIDTDKKKIKMVRIGAGQSRTFDY